VTTADASPLSAARRFTSAIDGLVAQMHPVVRPDGHGRALAGDAGQATGRASTSIGRAALPSRPLRLATS
jgi:hypothetical protein